MSLGDMGLDASRLIAGFCGGVLHAVAQPKMTPMSAISSVVAGTLVGNFLGLPAVHYVGDWLGVGGTCFIVGYSGLVICQLAMRVIERKIKSFDGAKP